MGSGNFFMAIIGSKERSDKGLKSKASKKKTAHSSSLVIPTEDWAATRIQTAFKAYKARKSLRRLKGIARAKLLTEKHSINKQAVVTLRYLHSWSKIQSQIKARRVCMVTEGRLTHKRLEKQQKLEAKLHHVEKKKIKVIEMQVEWNGGSETKEEILGRIHQREEATIKRERALAYAFSHQWKADGNTQWLGSYELGTTSWAWSWKQRWIAARPWELRHSFTRKKPQSSNTVCCNSETSSKRVLISSKPLFSGARNAVKPRRLSFPV